MCKLVWCLHIDIVKFISSNDDKIQDDLSDLVSNVFKRYP